LPLQKKMFQHHTTTVYFAAIKSKATVPEHTVASPHKNISPPQFHTCPVCCYQQYSHSSWTHCCLSTQKYFTTTIQHLSSLLLSTVQPQILNTLLPLHTKIFHHHHSTPVLFAPINSTATVPEHTVASPHKNISPPLHTCLVCCYQQYSHSSWTHCCFSTQQYFTTTTPHLSCLMLSTVQPQFLNTMLPLDTIIFHHHHSTPLLFAAINSTVTVPEHTVATPHKNISPPPLHTCPVCCYQQYSHSSWTHCCLSTQ